MAMRSATTKKPMAVTSSLNSIHVSPRTPRTPRPAPGEEDKDDVELSLLDEDQRRQAESDLKDLEDEHGVPQDISKKPISTKDKRNMVFLCVLCV